MNQDNPSSSSSNESFPVTRRSYTIKEKLAIIKKYKDKFL